MEPTYLPPFSGSRRNPSPWRQGPARSQIIVKEFALGSFLSILRAALYFVQEWEQKKVNRTIELEELIEYLEYFREAAGVIPLQAGEGENAVRLMTVHGAKGLEFPHVFILRANSEFVSGSYKETLVAFPRELRDPGSLTEADDKTLHAQEERRLFYVAMTRARDSLRIYAREGSGKNDKTPPGYVRELILKPTLAPWFRPVPALARRPPSIFAAAASPLYSPESQTSLWLEMPVLDGLHARLERLGSRYLRALWAPL